MNSIKLIAAERRRQIEEEGWTAKHDESHPDMALAAAGACYAIDLVAHIEARENWKRGIQEAVKNIWPFDFDEWFKPTREDPIRQLVKAGALIAAEIDRLSV